ncbi:MAG TPA: TetR/AcrR family transcriptional regulator [Tenuifilaceae bacterium]|nr:TetR/AcrR family transcriptional regulator [Tenuifilaceae bacterium]
MTELEKQTEEKIFEAATDVFIEKGMDGARMQEIADRAGINKALLHYYYRSKEKLFDAVFTIIAKQMLKRFAPVFDENLTLEEKIRFYYQQQTDFMKRSPRLPLFILNEVSRNPQRVKNVLKHLDHTNLLKILEEQHGDEFARYKINRETLPQIMTSIAAMSIFPFVAKPIIEAIFEKFGTNFNEYIERRVDFATAFTYNAIKSREK